MQRKYHFNVLRTLALAGMASAMLPMAAQPAHAAGVLTVAMTAGDLPVTTGNPDQGQGYRTSNSSRSLVR